MVIICLQCYIVSYYNNISTTIAINNSANGIIYISSIEIAVEMVAARLSRASLKGTQSVEMVVEKSRICNYCSRNCHLAIRIISI